MIGVVVGLFLLVGLSSIYISAVRGGRTTTSANQLNQEMRALMDIMVNDIRRAGYWGTATTGSANPFTAAATRPVIAPGGGCIAYSYDAIDLGGTPGAVDNLDRFGFRLTGGGVVQAVDPGSATHTATACGSATWHDLTDSVSTEVTQLTFDTAGSKCLAILAANPATQVPWTAVAGTTGPACTSAAYLAANPGGTPPDPTTHQFVETRRINITLAARSRVDPTLTATLTESVLVRANRVTIP